MKVSEQVKDLERDLEQAQERYNELSDLIQRIGTELGFSWEPDRSPRSMVAKMRAQIEIQHRKIERLESTPVVHESVRRIP